MDAIPVGTQAGPGLDADCISWHQGKRKGKCHLSRGIICGLQLQEGYDASPSLASIGILVMDIGTALCSSLGHRLGSGSFKFEDPAAILDRRNETSDWDEALRFYALQMWCPSTQFGCDKPKCPGCGSNLESNGFQTSVTPFKGLGGSDLVSKLACIPLMPAMHIHACLDDTALMLHYSDAACRTPCHSAGDGYARQSCMQRLRQPKGRS